MRALFVAVLLVLLAVPASAQWFRHQNRDGTWSYQNAETGQNIYFQRNKSGAVYGHDPETGQGQWFYNVPSQDQLPHRRHH